MPPSPGPAAHAVLASTAHTESTARPPLVQVWPPSVVFTRTREPDRIAHPTDGDAKSTEVSESLLTDSQLPPPSTVRRSPPPSPTAHPWWSSTNWTPVIFSGPPY